MLLFLRLHLVRSPWAWLVAGWLAAFALGAAAQPLLIGSDRVAADPLPGATWFVAEDGEVFPPDADALPAWRAARVPVDAAALLGGRHWLHAQLLHREVAVDWVVVPVDMAVGRAEMRLYGSDGSVQRVVTGGDDTLGFALHPGLPVHLQPGVLYDVVMRVESPYRAWAPRLDVTPAALQARRAGIENAVALGAMGAIAALAALFTAWYALARIRSHLLFAAQAWVAWVGWAMAMPTAAFQAGASGSRVQALALFLAPALGGLLCVEALQLGRRQPRIATALRVLAWGMALASPLAVVAVGLAHLVATALALLWTVLALAASGRALRRGDAVAAFFVPAFAALLLPGAVGLLAELPGSMALWMLAGSAVHALMLAMALVSRPQGHAGRHLEDMAPLTNALAAGDGGPQVLVALDVQGLRQMQDQDHQRAGGPADLGRAVATGLAGVADAGGRCFRLAGGDFAILAPAAQEPRLRLALARLEAELLAVDPKGAGLAYGVVRWTPPAPEPLQLLQQAATRMYAHKALRRGQAGGAPATNET